MKKIWAIVPAGGEGTRFGKKKQFERLWGQPILLHTLEKFTHLLGLEGVVVAVPENDIPLTRELLLPLPKKIKIVAGGRERQDSVYQAFLTLPPCEIVVVHDAVRPLVRRETIEKVIQTAGEVGACIVGTRVKETTKRVDTTGRVLETVARDSLWSIQTPQAFQYSLLKRAFQKAVADRFTGTDEAMLVERLGAPVQVIEGDSTNIKITTPGDLVLAEAMKS